MLVSLVTGLYLWWPRNRNWRVAFTLKRGARGRRRLLDLHNLFAVYLSVPLLIIALTGLYLSSRNGLSRRSGFCPRRGRLTPMRWLKLPDRGVQRADITGAGGGSCEGAVSPGKICLDDHSERARAAVSHSASAPVRLKPPNSGADRSARAGGCSTPNCATKLARDEMALRLRLNRAGRNA